MQQLLELLRRAPKRVAALRRPREKQRRGWRRLRQGIRAAMLPGVSLTRRGRPSAAGDTLYRRSVKKVPRVAVANNIEGLASRAISSFPEIAG